MRNWEWEKNLWFEKVGGRCVRVSGEGRNFLGGRGHPQRVCNPHGYVSEKNRHSVNN